jgi:Domain of unknown function (DUF1816)
MTLSTKSTKQNPSAETSLHWWIEVGTVNPICIYFFGPFEAQSEAESSKQGFVQDLESEKAWVIYSNTKLCQPRQLTIERDELTTQDLKRSMSNFFSGLVKRSEMSSNIFGT